MQLRKKAAEVPEGRSRRVVTLLTATAIAALLFVTLPLAALAQREPPMAVLAQGEPPHVLIGTVLVNGAVPPIGTEVAAYGGTVRLGVAFTRAGGQFTLYATRTSGVVTFTVGGLPSAETVPQWVSGERTRGLTLTVAGQVPMCAPTGLQNGDATGIAGNEANELPHVFIGQASLDGRPVVTGTAITAWDGTTLVGQASAAENGQYTIRVGRSSGPVQFRIGGLTAGQTFSPWTSGEITSQFALTATGAIHCLNGTVPVSALLNAYGSNLVRIFSFEDTAKKWLFYDSTVAEFSDLTHMIPGRPYYILITENLEARLNGSSRKLTCLGGNCWNVVVW